MASELTEPPEPKAWTASEIVQTPEAKAWVATLSRHQRTMLAGSLELLGERGPDLGRPLVDRVKRSRIHKLKELRVPSGNLRVLFAFDSNRRAVLLVGGDKTGDWDRWYSRSIPIAERLLERHERGHGEGVTCRTPKTGARFLDR